MKKLPVIIFVFIFIELYFLIRIGASLGALKTIALFVATSFIGVALIRWQGTATAVNMSRQFAQGVMPKLNVSNSLMMLFAGILLILPGFFTDFLGACLFVYGLIRQLFDASSDVSTARAQHTQYRNTSHHTYEQGSSKSQPRRHTTIDGEYKREDD